MASLQYQTLNQQVYSRLQTMILSGVLRLGEQLDERTLAADLEVSRTPIREAIGQLVKEGIIEYRPYRGSFIRTFTIKEVNDLFLVRAALEALAVRLAMPKISQEVADNIHQILDRVHEALEQEDMVAYSNADREFHETIMRLTGNETLIDSLNRLSFQIQMIRTIANRDPHVVERTHHERPLILAALEARDGELAAKLMEEHINGVRKAVVVQLESLEKAKSNEKKITSTKKDESKKEIEL
jgi:DNA-binding GntR family transcriptional regulator